MRNRGTVDDDDDDDFYNTSQGVAEQQRLLVREQDDTIGMLGESVQRVQHMALRVNEELATQNRMIDDIDDQVEKTDQGIRSLHTKLRKISNDTDRGKYCLIAVLLVLLLILTLMVLA